MKLSEILKLNIYGFPITRKKWVDNGSNIRLITDCDKVEYLNITLTQESILANDWEIIIEFEFTQHHL